MLVRFRTWWSAPTTRRDRATGCIVGLFAGFWLGALGRAAIGAAPFTEVLAWGAGGALLAAIAGLVAPKAVTVVLFPFAVFGAGT